MCHDTALRVLSWLLEQGQPSAAGTDHCQCPSLQAPRHSLLPAVLLVWHSTYRDVLVLALRCLLVFTMGAQEDAVVQLPIWGVALADSTWTPRALEELVSSATAMFESCQHLQPQQPLLAGRVCTWCAGLATALQHLAANADAPGMKAGLGAELRSVTGGLCVRLRDLFMPAGC